MFLTSMDDYPAMEAEYAKHFTVDTAMSCVAVHQLPRGVPIEIECIGIPP